MKDDVFSVSYGYYSDSMGRQVIPDKKTFNLYKDSNADFLRNISHEGLIVERGDNGIKNAICLMCEADFLHENESRASSVSSESIGGYSVSYDNTIKNANAERNAKSLERKKYDVIRRFCVVVSGVR